MPVSTITVTHTETHNVVTPANPFLVCGTCRKPVESFHNERSCGCGDDGRLQLFPCEHHSDYVDTCPSWGPVDGCQCQEHLGHVPHPVALA